MAKKFSIGNLNSNAKEVSLKDKAISLEHKKDFDVRFLRFDQLRPNPENFYKVDNIEKLAESIEEFGLMQNLEALKVENGDEVYYKLITGHRRYKAIEYLIKNGKIEEDRLFPVTVKMQLDEINEKLRLIKSNSDTREKTQEEKRKEIEELQILYSQKAEAEGVKISKKEIKKNIATDLGVSTKQVERNMVINENLIPQLKAYFDDNKITFNKAVELSRLEEQMQLAVYDLLIQKSKNEDENEKITDEEMNLIKEKNKRLIDELKQKDKLIEEKEEKINAIQSEKEDLENQLETNNVERETINEEKELLEQKIKEEVSKEATEKIDELTNRLKEMQEKEKRLLLEKDELNKTIKDKEDEIENIRNENATDIEIDNLQIQNEINKAKAEKLLEDITRNIKELEGLIATDNEEQLSNINNQVTTILKSFIMKLNE